MNTYQLLKITALKHSFFPLINPFSDFEGGD
jgi:hypothetical protein